MTTRSRKSLFVLCVCLLGAAGVVLGSVALIGKRVGSEILRYEALLIARDDISVVQFDYDSHFWGGELRYRLIWRPERGEGPLAQLLQTLEMPEERLTLAGSIDIRHGPWLGDMDVGLARVDLEIGAPTALREALPQYPGRAPLMTLTGTLGFSGTLRARLDVLDYDGRAVDGADVANLEVFGLNAELVVNRALDQFELNMDAPLLAFDVAGEGGIHLEGLGALNTLSRQQDGWTFTSDLAMTLLEVNDSVQGNAPRQDGRMNADTPLFALDRLSLQATLSQHDTEPLLSDSRMAFEAARLNLPEASVQLGVRDYLATSHAGLLDDTVTNTGALRVGALELNQERLGGLALETSLRGISAETYSALNDLWSLQSDLDTLDQTLGDALRALAQEQIVLSVDRLVLKLPDDEDVVATLTLEYEGSAQIDVDSIESITDAMQVEATVEASIEALERTFASSALSPAQQQTLQGLLASAQEQSYVTIEDGRLRSTALASAEQVLINGEPLEIANSLLAASSGLEVATKALDAPPSTQEPSAVATGSKTLSPETAALCPDLSLPGTALQYSSDALYTPQSLKVMAGGPADIAQCSSLPGRGFVTLAPDYTLTFTDNGSGRALEVRLESECDSVLLINDPLATWHFDDDSNGSMDALLRFNVASEGNYDIWIGSYESEGCNAAVTLETF